MRFHRNENNPEVNKARKFSSSSVLLNSGVSAVGAAAAGLAATGAMPIAIIGGALGGVVGYTITNEIPKKRKPESDQCRDP